MTAATESATDLLAARLPHQVMEAVKGFLLLGAKIVTFSIDRHTPDFAIGTIPRLCSTSHCNTLQRREAGEVNRQAEGCAAGPGRADSSSRPYSYARGRAKILYPILYPSDFELT